MQNKYGIFIGRFQPFHLGHQQVVDYIISQGLRPVLVLGSSDKEDTKNQLNSAERVALIREIYQKHQVDLLPLHDLPTDEEWAKCLKWYLKTFTGADPDNSAIFYTKKEEDTDPEGKHYIEKCLDTVFTICKIDLDKVPLSVSATSIREDLEANKHLLDARVYKLYKQFVDKNV